MVTGLTAQMYAKTLYYAIHNTVIFLILTLFMFSRGSYPGESYLSGKYLEKRYPDGKLPGRKLPGRKVPGWKLPGKKVPGWKLSVREAIRVRR